LDFVPAGGDGAASIHRCAYIQSCAVTVFLTRSHNEWFDMPFSMPLQDSTRNFYRLNRCFRPPNRALSMTLYATDGPRTFPGLHLIGTAKEKHACFPSCSMAIVNPVIESHEGSVSTFFEGYLSLHGFTSLVSWASDARHQVGTRIPQHEIDSMDGTSYIDRMHAYTFLC
jgi:hypothetical protein